jgi:hypothetical protein
LFYFGQTQRIGAGSVSNCPSCGREGGIKTESIPARHHRIDPYGFADQTSAQSAHWHIVQGACDCQVDQLGK